MWTETVLADQNLTSQNSRLYCTFLTIYYNISIYVSYELTLKPLIFKMIIVLFIAGGLAIWPS